MENSRGIDFQAIEIWQGYELKGYVPSNSSGVTICVGLDLTTQSIEDMKKYELSQNLIDKLSKYIGLKGNQAKQYLKIYPLNVNKNEAIEINQYMIDKYGSRLQDICEVNKIDYKLLPSSVKTVLFSRVVHTWKLKRQVIQCLKKKDYQGICDQLEKLEGYGARGKNEAAYLRLKLNRQNNQQEKTQVKKKKTSQDQPVFKLLYSLMKKLKINPK